MEINLGFNNNRNSLARISVRNGGYYTKHVYMGSQRITSKVSNSGIFTASPVTTTELQAKLTAQTTKIKERFDSLGVKYSGLQQTGGLISSSPSGVGGSYFYHPDHLGSSSLITNGIGDLVQHIQYVPFGEVFVEERNATWSTPYKFNGKEQDEETGLCYYGARYYDPRTSVWLSVDPLAEKYPNISSYVYVENNPIKYIDPDGREKLNFFNFWKDPTLWLGAYNTPTDDRIHLFSHGNPIEVRPAGEEVIKTGIQMDEFLMKHSETYRENKKSGKTSILVLHACRTSKVAEKLVKEMENVTIIAPDQRDYFEVTGEIGPYKAQEQNSEGDYTNPKNHSKSETKGNWILYKRPDKLEEKKEPVKLDDKYILYKIPEKE